MVIKNLDQIKTMGTLAIFQTIVERDESSFSDSEARAALQTIESIIRAAEISQHEQLRDSYKYAVEQGLQGSRASGLATIAVLRQIAHLDWVNPYWCLARARDPFREENNRVGNLTFSESGRSAIWTGLEIHKTAQERKYHLREDCGVRELNGSRRRHLDGPTIERVERKIGEGSQSSIYLATTQDQEKIALKILKKWDVAKLLVPKEFFPVDRIVEDRLQFAKDVMHPLFRGVLGHGICIDPISFFETRYLALPFVDGIALEARDEEGKWKPTSHFSKQDAIEVTVQVLDALGAAHGAGYVVCDARLSNVMREHDTGNLVFIDTTLVEKIESAPYSPFNTGSTRYVDPQLRATLGEETWQKACHTVTSDLYSVATCALYLLRGEVQSLAEINTLEKAEYEGALQSVLSEMDLSTTQRDFFTKALSYNREDRYQSALELSNDLTTAFDH